MSLFIFHLTVFASIGAAYSAKILLLPTALSSHAIELLGTGEEMANRGHQVFIYLPSYHNTNILKNSPVRVITYNFPEEYRIMFQNGMDSEQSGTWKGQIGTFERLVNLKTMIKGMCLGLISDTKQIQYLARQKFDVAIVLALPFSQCLFCLPYHLNISTIAASSYIAGFQSGTPLQTNSVSHTTGAHIGKMNVFQRLSNFFSSVMFQLCVSYISPDMSQLDPRFSGMDMDKLVHRSLLFIENSDHVFDNPKAIFPNFIRVGGVTARSPKPLNKSLEEFIARSSRDVIFLSFGTAAPLKFAPKSMMNNLLNALHEQEYNVLMKSDSEYEDGNIKFSKWFSQNDILGHPKTKLFITHCGKNGIFESIFHAVPIICSPRGADQPWNAKRMKELSIGILLNFETASQKEISDAIHEGIHNNTYSKNIKRLSEIFRDRPDTPAQRAASAIEHVLKYGSDHLTPPTKHLTTVEHLYADIWFFIYSAVLICVYIIWTFCKKIISFVRKSTKIKTN